MIAYITAYMVTRIIQHTFSELTLKFCSVDVAFTQPDSQFRFNATKKEEPICH